MIIPESTDKLELTPFYSFLAAIIVLILFLGLLLGPGVFDWRGKRSRRKSLALFDSSKALLYDCFNNLNILSEALPSENGDRVVFVASFDNILTSGDAILVRKGDRIYKKHISPFSFSISKISNPWESMDIGPKFDKQTWLFVVFVGAKPTEKIVKLDGVHVDFIAAPAGFLRFNIMALTSIWNFFAAFKIPLLTPLVTAVCVFFLGFCRSVFDQHATLSSWHRGVDRIKGAVKVKPAVVNCEIEDSDEKLKIYLTPRDPKNSREYIERGKRLCTFINPAGCTFEFRTTYDVETYDF